MFSVYSMHWGYCLTNGYYTSSDEHLPHQSVLSYDQNDYLSSIGDL